jgi:hypothetical protein
VRGGATNRGACCGPAGLTIPDLHLHFNCFTPTPWQHQHSQHSQRNQQTRQAGTKRLWRAMGPRASRLLAYCVSLQWLQPAASVPCCATALPRISRAFASRLSHTRWRRALA